MTEQEMTKALSSLLGAMAGVGVKVHAHRSSYTVGEKIFAFTRKEGLAMKLPSARVQELSETREASALVMGKRAMKEWLVMRYDDAASLRKDKKLLKESIAFTAAKG